MLARPQPAGDIEALASAAGMDAATFVAQYWAHRQAFDLGGGPVPYWSAVTGRPVDEAGAGRLEDLDHVSWSHPDPAMLALVERLLAAGTGVCLLSNAPSGLAAAVDRLPWMQPVTPRFYSCRLLVTKPDPRAWWAVLAQLGAAPADPVFVDDRPANVAGAERLGIPSILFTSAQEVADRLQAG